MIKKPSFAGLFYPETYSEVADMINSFKVDSSFDSSVKAIIVPHAGYVYSGQTAAKVYSLLDSKSYDRVFIVAPSHRYSFKGVTVSRYDSFLVPDQNLEGDIEIYEYLQSEMKIDFIEKVFRDEHSYEVQLPMIKYFLGDKKTGGLIYSDVDPVMLAEILQKLVGKFSKTLIVISTDLSHFKNLNNCKITDQYIIDGLLNNSMEMVVRGEACGMTGILAIMEYVKRNGLSIKLIDYSTSANCSGDENRVVGYGGFVIC
ncbi:MAG: AmmeMemoRadiSam system protein B [Candidatus Delongbacteria bacterium]|nr:AmmeMemoRadiSam system protein B [Candidatus Delongbacteria bacterium]MBN2836771.1 AmmeMemoRadiSam system protein B [Candidatus Delongbacteria bacterium]